MITEQNLKELLATLGFRKSGDIYAKQFAHFNASMSVDFAAKKLIYPDGIIGKDRNTGFDKPENFVVFECVDRLLEKGYRPEHLELEREWQLGHDTKSGRADICVSDRNGSLLFIIECKTWGKEFDKALKKTKNDGDQLFSYWQQEQSCRWLVLYASEIENGTVIYKAPVINCMDDKNLLVLARKDRSIKLYRDAHTVKEKHQVWAETYRKKFYDDLVFAPESSAYRVGILPLLKKTCGILPRRTA